MSDYYVYVYIDPRNFEEFYYGKGKGSRKDAHLSDNSDSEKARRISAIHKAGLEPIIRVISRGLTEHDALLVEKTLLWKLGKQLTNVSSGHYSDKFRPHNMLHAPLTGFDYQCGFYYYNVGEKSEGDGFSRNWDDYVRYGFISAGQGTRWRDAMLGFNIGDVVAAYLKGYGYVGIGQLTSRAKPIRDVSINGKPLLSCTLKSKNLDRHLESDEDCEYVATIKWIKTTNRADAKWKAKSGIYTTTHVRASLDGQPNTVAFLEEAFNLKVSEYVV
jgi:uncharacterized protein